MICRWRWETLNISMTARPGAFAKRVTQILIGVTRYPPGNEKSLRVELAGDLPKVTISQTLTNHNARAGQCAPWAITQFKPGGVAILPLNRTDSAMLPNCSLAIWSHTDLSGTCLHWGREHPRILAKMTSFFMIGFPNPRGWLL